MAAADLAGQGNRTRPVLWAGSRALGRSQAALGRGEEAVAALTRALAIEPEDALGVRIDLARLEAIPPESAISDGYVRALFDDYASGFDRHLVKSSPTGDRS